MRIETGDDVARARRTLGLSSYELADLLRLGADTKAGAAKIREIEAGNRRLTGALSVAIEAILSGWRPDQSSAK